MQVEKTIPLFPLGLVLLPQTPLPLHIFEERYKMMIGECLKQNKQFGIVYYNGTDIQTAGCTAGILKVLKRYDDGRLDILTRGDERFIIQEMVDAKPYLEARVTFFDDEEEKNEDACQLLADKGMRLLKRFISISGAQDSYSFEIAEVFLGSDSQSSLLARYRTALELLPFEIATAESIAA